MHNPYSPPVSKELEVQLPVARRPISVWIFLLVFAILFALFGFGLVGSMWQSASSLSESQEYVRFSVGLVMSIAILAAALVLPIGVYRRRQWARWIGVVAIGSILLAMLLLPDTTQYANSDERLGGMIARMFIFPLLFLVWAYRFGFSSKSKMYFAKKAKRID